MGAQLAASRTPILAATLPRTIAVIAAARHHAQLVIQPELDGIGMMDWRQLDRARTAGRAAAREALEQARPSPFFQALA
jgi:NTE family protein